MSEPSFTMGIEEEYLLIDKDTLALAEAPKELMDDCKSALGDQVSPEFLKCQVEIGTRVCKNISEARDDLKRLRTTVAEIAGRYGLAPLVQAGVSLCYLKELPTQDNLDSSGVSVTGGNLPPAPE